MSEAQKAAVYARIYLIALVIPLISVAGVALGALNLRLRAGRMRREGVDEDEIRRLVHGPAGETEPNAWIFGGSLAFVAFTLSIGLAGLPFAQEIVLVGSALSAMLGMGVLARVLPKAPADATTEAAGSADRGEPVA